MNIQIMKTYNESFHNVRTHKRAWMRVAAGPVIIWALGALFLALTIVSSGQHIDIYKSFTGETYVETQTSGFAILGHLVYNITYFIAITSLYINGYRYALFQEGGDRWFTLNLNWRFVRMVLYTILLSILAILYIAISVGIILGAHALFAHIALNVILGILLVIGAFYLMLRIILFQLVISIDQNQPMRTSWRLMKGNVLRFLGLSLLIGLTILLITIIGGILLFAVGAIFFMASSILGMLVALLGFLFFLFIVLLTWAVNSKMMGIVYQDLSKNTQSEITAA